MIMVRQNKIIRNKIGIMPIGALSIAFTKYMDIDTFIESGEPHYGIGKKIKISTEDKIIEIVLTEENYAENISSLNLIPEVVLFSPPNHRLILAIEEIIYTIEKIIRTGYINLKNDVDVYIPKFVMLSNGIYYDQVIEYITKNLKYVEKDILEEIKGNFVRATTLQSGVRTGIGEDIIFIPGQKGNINITGGSKSVRDKIISLFNKYDYPIFDMGDVEVRNVEFEKALLSISSNGVQLSSILDDKDRFRSLTLGDLISDKKIQERSKKMIHTMTSIGIKTGMLRHKYLEKDLQQSIDIISQEMWEKLRKKSEIDSSHIVSSIAIVSERYRLGTLENKLPALEENIINYVLNLEGNIEKEKNIIKHLRECIMRNIDASTKNK